MQSQQKWAGSMAAHHRRANDPRCDATPTANNGRTWVAVYNTSDIYMAMAHTMMIIASKKSTIDWSAGRCWIDMRAARADTAHIHPHASKYTNRRNRREYRWFTEWTLGIATLPFISHRIILHWFHTFDWMFFIHFFRTWTSISMMAFDECALQMRLKVKQQHHQPLCIHLFCVPSASFHHSVLRSIYSSPSFFCRVNMCIEVILTGIVTTKWMWFLKASIACTPLPLCF